MKENSIAFKYITNELEKALIKFPFISIRYENSKEINSHFIEVIPKNANDNENITDWQWELITDFIQEFPDQNISFVLESDYVGISNVDFQKSGVLFSKYISNDKEYKTLTTKEFIRSTPANCSAKNYNMRSSNNTFFIESLETGTISYDVDSNVNDLLQYNMAA